MRVRPAEPRPAWQTALATAIVVLLAVIAVLAFVLIFGGQSPTGEASPTPSAGPGSPSASPSPGESPAASPEQPQATPVVDPPEDFLPPGSLARVLADGLTMHEEPSADAAEVATLAAGELVGIGYSYLHPDWSREIDGQTWYPVRPLGTSDVPPVPWQPLEPTDLLGWVAGADDSGPTLELVPPRCVAGEPDLEILQSLLPWEQLACYGGRSLTVEGVFGCGECGGLFPGDFAPDWLAHPTNFNLLSVQPEVQMGPMTLHFPPDGPEPPEPASIIRVTGHFDDPAARDCTVAPGESPQPIHPEVAELYCRERFVVESYEVLGIDEDFPSG